MQTLLTLLRLSDESKVAGGRGVSRVGAKSVLVVVQTLFVLVFELCLYTFFLSYLVKGWHRVIKNRQPSKK